MQNNNKFLNDMARMASGAVGGLMDVKREIEVIVGEQLEKLLQKMNLVTKEEFDTTQAMLIKSRNEQEELKKRLDALEEQINTLTIGEKSTK
ncbi:MAG: accessory factor UbiK family protein [Pseudomonadota bacterium]